MAIDPKFLDDLATRLANAMPGALRDLQSDAQKNARAVLQSAFSKLNLVTREEFDIQTQVLARTRAHVTELEHQVAQLEAALRAAGTLPNAPGATVADSDSGKV